MSTSNVLKFPTPVANKSKAEPINNSALVTITGHVFHLIEGELLDVYAIDGEDFKFIGRRPLVGFELALIQMLILAHRFDENRDINFDRLRAHLLAGN